MSEPEETPYTTFTYSGDADHSVALVGCFNSWHGDNDMLTKNADGTWSITKALPAGRYEYKFVIDGEKWIQDPNAKESDPDGVGGQHSVLTVGNGGVEDIGANNKLVVNHDRGVAYSQ